MWVSSGEETLCHTVYDYTGKEKRWKQENRREWISGISEMEWAWWWELQKGNVRHEISVYLSKGDTWWGSKSAYDAQKKCIYRMNGINWV